MNRPCDLASAILHRDAVHVPIRTTRRGIAVYVRPQTKNSIFYIRNPLNLLQDPGLRRAKHSALSLIYSLKIPSNDDNDDYERWACKT